MLAMGTGGLDVVMAMAGGAFYLPPPKVIRINLEGSLMPWISAKDVVLKVLSILGTKGNVGYIIEYGGSGLTELDVPSRATITNMGAELGVTTQFSHPMSKLGNSLLPKDTKKIGWNMAPMMMWSMRKQLLSI